MKIIALEVEEPGVKGADFAQHLDAEAAAVYELQQKGIIRAIHFRADRDEAVLELECSSASEAERILAEMPLVKAGLIRFELIPLRPYPGFKRLFKDHG